MVQADFHEWWEYTYIVICLSFTLNCQLWYSMSQPHTVIKSTHWQKIESVRLSIKL